MESVKTTITKGKVKPFRGQLGKRTDVKKAYVTREVGNTIDVAIVFCGVGCPFNNGLTNDDLVTVDFLNTLTLQEITAFDANDMELPDLEIFGSVSGDTVVQRNNTETPEPGESSDLSAVPLPASGWMLIATILGLGTLRRCNRH